MFIEINNVNYNMYSVTSFKKTSEIAQNSDGSEVTKYFIVYTVLSGITIKEEFQNQSDRDAKYDEIVEKFVVS